MKKSFIKKSMLLICTLAMVIVPSNATYAHQGKLDKNGGHNKTEDGTYHYHDGDDRTVEHATPPNETATPPNETTTQPNETTQVATSTEEIKILFDGEYLATDVAPVIIEGRTLVPARVIVDAAGGTTSWDDPTNIVTINKSDTTILLTIDSATAIVNGSSVALDVPAQIIDGRTMVPLRFVAENLGLKVDFYNNTVIILSDVNADVAESKAIIDEMQP